MKEKVFNTLLAAVVTAVVTIIVIFQEEALSNSETLTMASIGSIAGMLVGVMKMLAVSNKFDKWELLSYFVGVVE